MRRCAGGAPAEGERALPGGAGGADTGPALGDSGLAFSASLLCAAQLPRKVRGAAVPSAKG